MLLARRHIWAAMVLVVAAGVTLAACSSIAPKPTATTLPPKAISTSVHAYVYARYAIPQSFGGRGVLDRAGISTGSLGILLAVAGSNVPGNLVEVSAASKQLNVLERAPVGAYPTVVSADSGSAWVLNSAMPGPGVLPQADSGTVFQFNRVLNMTYKYRLPTTSAAGHYGNPFAMVSSGSTAWVVYSGPSLRIMALNDGKESYLNSLPKISWNTNVSGNPSTVALCNLRLWLATSTYLGAGSTKLYEINLSSGHLVKQLTLPGSGEIHLACAPSGVLVAGDSGALYLASSSGAVKISPAATVSSGLWVTSAVVVGSVIWASCLVGAEGHELVAYNLRSPHQVLGRMNLGSGPQAGVSDLVANGNTLIGLSSPFNLVIIKTANTIS